MEQYIPKSALVAEIEKRMLRYEQERKTEPAYYDGLYTALEDLRDDFINTLEVKEVEWTEEDMKLIWTIGDELPYMSEEEFYKELLKRYKAHKGE